jgi:hypothetical protein
LKLNWGSICKNPTFMLSRLNFHLEGQNSNKIKLLLLAMLLYPNNTSRGMTNATWSDRWRFHRTFY